jgi:hypothetical protein
MSAVVMCPALDLSGTHRQQGARAVQGLNLGFSSTHKTSALSGGWR